jgi:hypothetical protein
MKKIMSMILMSMFIVSGCASNPIVNGKNVGGAIGAGGGAYGASVLCKNCKGIAKVGAIGLGAVVGLIAGSYAGENWWDKPMRARQVKLIESVLENNQTNETSIDTYKKVWRNPDGQQQTGMVQSSATPLRTYPPANQYASNQVYQGLPNGHPDKWKSYTYTQPNQYQYNQTGVCRDLEITFTIQADNAPPSTQQYYKMCKTEQGWRQVQ